MLLGAAIVWDLDRQRNLAAQLAMEEAAKTLGGRPLDVIDTDSFDRTWSVLVEGEDGAAVLVNVHGTRGVPFLPLLNNRTSMQVESAVRAE